MEQRGVICALRIFAIVLMLSPLFLAATSVRAGEARAKSQEEWDLSREAAKKEGKVVVYFWQGGNLEKAILAFNKRYPDIPVNAVGSRGSNFILRIISEMRAGKYLADVCLWVTSPYEVLYKQNALEPLKPALLLPEVADESKWWQGKHHFQDAPFGSKRHGISNRRLYSPRRPLGAAFARRGRVAPFADIPRHLSHVEKTIAIKHERRRGAVLELKQSARRRGERKQPFYGLTLVSCERGDMRQSPDGLYSYTEQGRAELACPSFLDRGAQLLKLYEAVTQNRSFITDGSWGKASLEVVLAILPSSKERREITLSHQVSTSV